MSIGKWTPDITLDRPTTRAINAKNIPNFLLTKNKDVARVAKNIACPEGKESKLPWTKRGLTSSNKTKGLGVTIIFFVIVANNQEKIDGKKTTNISLNFNLKFLNGVLKLKPPSL